MEWLQTDFLLATLLTWRRHLESYNPDDNRHEYVCPFFNVLFPWRFAGRRTLFSCGGRLFFQTRVLMTSSLRPFLYVIDWPWQFNKIGAHVEEMERSLKMKKEGQKGQ